jgi:hypothetical protein
MTQICAACGAQTETSAFCPACGKSPLLDDRYRLEAILGRGASGITYAATIVATSARVAVKELPIRAFDGVKAFELFDREARVLRQLDHPSIPRVFDDFAFGEGKAASLYLVQELIDGRTLDAELETRRFDESSMLGVLAELADILVYLHGLSPPVVHRDIKLKNVMRRSDGRLVLIDFGAVRESIEVQGGSTVAGTFGYMAPEQLAGHATPASDVYGLGALAIALLTRRDPATLLGHGNTLDWEASVQLTSKTRELVRELLDERPAARPAAAVVAQRARDLVEERRRRSAARAERPRTKEPAPALGVANPVDPTPKAPAPRNGPRDKPKRGRGGFLAQLHRKTIGSGDYRILGIPLVLLAMASPLLWGFIKARGWFAGHDLALLSGQAVVTPEIYAKPVLADVDGDGALDVVFAGGRDIGPDPEVEGTDTHWKEHGRYATVVQAVSGRTGEPLYTLDGLDGTYGPDPKASGFLKVGLAATDEDLVIVSVGPSGSRVHVHRLRSGELRKTLEPPRRLSGRLCVVEGAVVMEAEVGFVALDAAALTLDQKTTRGCDGKADDARVASAPLDRVSSRAPLEAELEEVPVPSGPYAARRARSNGERFALLDDHSPPPYVGARSPSLDPGGGLAPGFRSDSREMDIVVLDERGAVHAKRSLFDLGLTYGLLHRIELTHHHVVLTAFDAVVVTNLEAEVVARYALPRNVELRGTRYRAESDPRKSALVLALRSADNTDHSSLSKKIGLRFVLLDLGTGNARSLQQVTETPAAPPRAPQSLDPVAGCRCRHADGPTVELAMARAGLKGDVARLEYGLVVDGRTLPLGPYFEARRARLAPPPYVRGDAVMSITCERDRVIVRSDRYETEWSLDDGRELATRDRPDDRMVPSATAVAGASSIRCTSEPSVPPP